jgi:hypothetical protein
MGSIVWGREIAEAWWDQAPFTSDSTSQVAVFEKVSR